MNTPSHLIMTAAFDRCRKKGSRTPDEVDANADAARRFQIFSEERLRDLEERNRPEERVYTSYKKAR